MRLNYEYEGVIVYTLIVRLEWIEHRVYGDLIILYRWLGPAMLLYPCLAHIP